jgi:hypothetical protein
MNTQNASAALRDLDYNLPQEDSRMWPLSIVLLFATAPQPQQSAPVQQGAYIGKIPVQVQLLQHRAITRKLSPQQRIDWNTCYTVRSYHFERQDGQAPVLTAMTTCTPARILEQKRVSPTPGVMYVPLTMQREENSGK